MAKEVRKFNGINAARKNEARVREDILEAIECGIVSNVANSLKIRGKRKQSMLPNADDNVLINRGHGKNYGARSTKDKVINRRSIRENPLTEDDFYEPELD